MKSKVLIPIPKKEKKKIPPKNLGFKPGDKHFYFEF